MISVRWFCWDQVGGPGGIRSAWDQGAKREQVANVCIRAGGALTKWDPEVPTFEKSMGMV